MRKHHLTVTLVAAAVAVESPRGWRLAKEKASSKIDGAVALSFACLAAVREGASLPWVSAAYGEFTREEQEDWRAQRGTPRMAAISSVSLRAGRMPPCPGLAP